MTASDEILSVDELREYFESIILNLTENTSERFSEFDKKLEAMEKQIATLVVGFGEQAVFLEALLAQLAFASEDQQKVFQDNVNQARREMLKVMQDGAKTVVADQDERLATALTDVVNSKSLDS
jgi:protein involved in temperature-dependent protein secretion